MNKYEKIFKRMKLPKDYWDCKISKIPDDGSDNNKYRKPYKEVVSDWVLNFGKEQRCKGFYLYGDYGSGKSGIGAILLKAAGFQGKTALWVDFPLLHDYSINKEKHIYEADITLLDRMHDVDVLFIDEILIDKSSRWAIRVLESIIRVRYQNCRVTIVASNSSPNDLAKSGMTRSLASILSDATIGLEVKGKNFRKK